jgi:hypothetical protein
MASTTKTIEGSPENVFKPTKNLNPLRSESGLNSSGSVTDADSLRRFKPLYKRPEDTFRPPTSKSSPGYSSTDGRDSIPVESPEPDRGSYFDEVDEADAPRNLWDLDPLIKGLEEAQDSPPTESPTFWDIRQQEENMFANIFLRCSKIESYVDELIGVELDAIDNIQELLVSNISDKSEQRDSQLGGHMNVRLNENVVVELNRKEGDSQHDFKPSKTRNNAFPREITGQDKFVNVINGKIVLDRISKILEKSQSNTTLLNEYFMKSPNNFEEDIKVDYLLGEIAGELTDVNYYFTDPREIPDTWERKRREFFSSSEKINTFHKLFADVQEHGIDYWLFDACMSSRVKNGMIPERFTTLANIWDPAPGRNPKLEDLSEYKLSNDPATMAISRFIEQPEITRSLASRLGDRIYERLNPPYTVHNWVNPTSGKSYYDSVYDELINQDVIRTTFGLFIRLRLALDKDRNTSVALCTYLNDQLLNVYLVNGGFSVNELSMGMHYIETGDPELDVISGRSVRVQVTHPVLRKLIDELNANIRSEDKKHPDAKMLRTTEFFNNEYYKLLLRFKSSGDHGQANTAKMLNNMIKKNTLFMSGDNLAFVYSIASETPTIANYYKSPKRGGKEDDDDDDDDEVDTGSPQFIVGYFPMKDSKEKYEKYFNRQISVIGNVFNSGYQNPNYANPSGMVISKDELNRLRNETSRLIQENEGFILELKSENDSINSNVKASVLEPLIAKINDRIETISEEIPISRLEAIPQSSDRLFLLRGGDYDYAKMAEYVKLLTDFANSCYFIKNYIKIIQLIKSNVDETVKNMKELVLLDETEITSSLVKPLRSGRHSGRQMNVNVKGLIGEFQNSVYRGESTIGKEQLAELGEMRDPQGKSKGATETTINDKLGAIYSKLITVKSALSDKMTRELRLDRNAYMSINNRIETIRNGYLDKLRSKINEVEVFGPALNEYFDKCFGNEVENDGAISVAFNEGSAVRGALPKVIEESIAKVRGSKAKVSPDIFDLVSSSNVGGMVVTETLPDIPFDTIERKPKKVGRPKKAAAAVIEETVFDDMLEGLSATVDPEENVRQKDKSKSKPRGDLLNWDILPKDVQILYLDDFEGSKQKAEAFLINMHGSVDEAQQALVDNYNILKSKPRGDLLNWDILPEYIAKNIFLEYGSKQNAESFLINLHGSVAAAQLVLKKISNVLKSTEIELRKQLSEERKKAQSSRAATKTQGRGGSTNKKRSLYKGGNNRTKHNKNKRRTRKNHINKKSKKSIRHRN